MGKSKRPNHGSSAARHCGSRPRNPISTFVRIAGRAGVGQRFWVHPECGVCQGSGVGVRDLAAIKMQRTNVTLPQIRTRQGLHRRPGPLLRSPAMDGMSGCRSVRFSSHSNCGLAPSSGCAWESCRPEEDGWELPKPCPRPLPQSRTGNAQHLFARSC
jgi:hypothetical protein